MLRSIPAAFNPDRSLAPDTQFWPNRPQVVVPDRLPDDVPVVMSCDEEVVWGGCVQSHFGHFLTESVSRLWPLLPGGALEGLPVVCTQSSRYPYQREWADAFGMRTIGVPKGGAGRFKRVSVPEPAWLLNAWIAPEIRDIHLHARQSLDIPTFPEQGVLWLSRSALDRDLRAYDEVLLEWLLGDHVTIIHPETRTLVEQIAAIEASDGVAGLVGSAFHTLLTTADPPDCVLLCKNRELTHYFAQDRLLKTNGTFVQALATAEMRHRRRSQSLGGHRVLVPEALRALGATLLPALRTDPAIASLMHPECLELATTRKRQGDDIYRAVAKVLLDPYSARVRLDLGSMFQARNLSQCALEQFLIVAELSDNRNVAALIRAARLLAEIGEPEEASAMARQVLAIDPESKEAMGYILES